MIQIILDLAYLKIVLSQRRELTQGVPMDKGLVKLGIDDITAGKPLPWSLYDKNGIVIFNSGFVFRSDSQVDRISSWELFNASNELSALANHRINPSKAQNDEAISSFDLVENIISQLAVTLANRDNPDINFADAIMILVDEIEYICSTTPDAALAALFVVKTGEYSIRHSVDVALLTCMVCHIKDLDERRRPSAVAAALTMNIAMLDLQDELYGQALPLSWKQKNRFSITLLRAQKYLKKRMWMILFGLIWC